MSTTGIILTGIDNHDLELGTYYAIPFVNTDAPMDTQPYGAEHVTLNKTIDLPTGCPSTVYARACYDVSVGSGTVTLELLKNGSVVDSDSVSEPFGFQNSVCLNVRSGGYPQAEANGISGDAFSLRTIWESETDPPGGVTIGDAESEFPGFFVVRSFCPEGLNNDDLCDSIIASLDEPLLGETGRHLVSYVASTQAPLLVYDDPIGQVDDMSPNSEGHLFVAELQFGDGGLNGWVADVQYCLGNPIIGDGKVFIVTAASGATDPNTGLLGGSEPSWPTSGSIADGGVTWTFVGDAAPEDIGMWPHWSNLGGQGTIGTEILTSDDSKLFIISSIDTPLEISNCGISGATEPTWPSSGDVVDNGQITWTFVRLAYTGDQRTFIEEYDTDGSSLGIWSVPDFQLDLDIAMKAHAIRVDDDDTVWLLAFLNELNTFFTNKLALFHFDTDGTLIDSWTDLANDGSFGRLSLDIAKFTHIAFYTMFDGQNLRAYDPVNSTDLGVIYTASNGSSARFGPLRLILSNTEGGILVGQYGDDFVELPLARITEVGCTGDLKGWVPIADIGNNPPLLLCHSEVNNVPWAQDTPNRDHVVKVNINPATYGDMLLFDHAANRITSCTVELGLGLVCPPSGGFFPYITLIGAN